MICKFLVCGKSTGALKKDAHQSNWLNFGVAIGLAIQQRDKKGPSRIRPSYLPRLQRDIGRSYSS
jgi:hypothetical protein